MNDPVSSDPSGSDRSGSDRSGSDRSGSEPSTGGRDLTLPPLDHGDDDWAAPIPQAGRSAVVGAWVLLGLTVAGISFAAGARIGRDRAPAAGPGAFLRSAGAGGLVGGFGGGLAGSGGLPSGAQRGTGTGGPTAATPTTATPAAAAGSAPVETASSTSAPADQALAGLLPGFEAPPAADPAPAAEAPPVTEATEVTGATAGGPATELGRVSAVEGRTVTVTGPDGQRVVFRLPDGVAAPAVGSTVRAG